MELNFNTIWFNKYWRGVKLLVCEFLPGEKLSELKNISRWVRLNNNYVIKHMKNQNCSDRYVILGTTDNWSSTSNITVRYEYRIPLDLDMMLYKYATKETYLQIKQKLIDLVEEIKEENETIEEGQKPVGIVEVEKYTSFMKVYD